MPSKLITSPNVEPLSLAEAKLHLRVDTNDEDTLISSLIVSARMAAENICRRALVTQSWRVVIDQFPSPAMNIGSANWYGPQWGISPGPLTVMSPEGKTGFEIFLPMSPLVSVDSIKYIDIDGVQQTLANTEYLVDAVSEPARITPAYGKSWPSIRNQAAAVEVSFTCGYGSASAVPEGIKAWIKIRVGSLYEFREEVAIMTRGKIDPLPFVDSLLDQYRVINF